VSKPNPSKHNALFPIESRHARKLEYDVAWSTSWLFHRCNYLYFEAGFREPFPQLFRCPPMLEISNVTWLRHQKHHVVDDGNVQYARVYVHNTYHWRGWKMLTPTLTPVTFDVGQINNSIWGRILKQSIEINSICTSNGFFKGLIFTNPWWYVLENHIHNLRWKCWGISYSLRIYPFRRLDPMICNKYPTLL